MRVLTVGWLFPPYHLGGYEEVWSSFVGHARDEGHDVRVLCSDERLGRPRAADDPGVHRDLRVSWTFGEGGIGRRERLRRERHNAAVFERHVGDLQPDLVMWWHLRGISVGLVARAGAMGLRHLAVVHDLWPVYAPEQDGWLGPWSRRPRLRSPAAALTGLPTTVDFSAVTAWSFNSAFLRRCVADAVGLPADADVSVVPPGIPRDAFPPAPAAPWGWRLAYVGRVDERKGIAVALDALATLPAARLTVTGDGDVHHLEWLHGKARALGVADRVSFRPAVERKRLHEVYAAADVVLFPVVWDEPWGLVPLEAMAVGRPVVATGTGGSAEYLRDGENALIVPPGDAAALARAVDALAADGDLRARLLEGGRTTAARHLQEASDRRLLEHALRVAAPR